MPQSFDSLSQYTAVFKALMLEELRAQLLSTLQEKENAEAGPAAGMEGARGRAQGAENRFVQLPVTVCTLP